MDPREYDWQMGDLARQDIYPDERYMQPPPAIPASTGEGYAGLGGDPSHLATTIKNWWTNQPSWLEKAQAENQKTTEAFQRGGMGEIAKQLATDTTEPQELYGAFGVGNVARVPRSFTTVRGPIGGSDPNYVYHATSAERAGDISESGLQTYKPHEFTDQSAWPDRSAEKRNYFTPTSENTWQFAPEEGNPVLLRIKKDAHDFKRESTGDIYSTQSVPASKIEYLDQSGKWLPLSDTAPGELAALDQYRPPFYSAVEQAVQGAKQNAAPGQQWAGYLRNQPGVKQEEVETLGLGKLFEQPTVSKDALLGEIAANRVNVGEVVKGANEFSGLDMEGIAQKKFGSPYDELSSRQRSEVQSLAFNPPETPTKFSQYTLPGGENYREMLLTLPKKPKDIGPAPELLTELPKGPDWENSYRVIHYAGDGPQREWGVIPPGQSHARAMAGQHPTEAEAVRQALNHINAQNAQQYNQALHDANKSGQFTSSHYDEPNILAHVRYNDRVIDGKKTLFVEEVQSDWHQKGKREGYQSSEPPAVPFTMSGEGPWVIHQGDRFIQDFNNRSAAQAQLEAYNRGAIRPEGDPERIGKVPDAPFKTTWPELAMKRIIREAAEKGYDKVAWTPGSVQAERYDLSKHVDSLHYNPDTKELRAYRKGEGSAIISKNDIEPKDLPNIVGKDVAEKLVNAPLDKTRNPAFGRVHSLEGTDLKVGGEGMKGFYDEILPATVNKLVKKHGGRVTQGELRTAEQNPLAAKLKDNGYDPDTVDIQHILTDNGGRMPRWLNNAELEAIQAGEHLDFLGVKRDKVHTIDITPQLRAQAMKGFPLFTAGGVAATGVISDLARQDEYR